MLVKFINKTEMVYANYYRTLEYNNKQVINPREEDFINAGYKELIEDEIPTYDEETEYLSINYEDTENTVLLHYTVNEIPEETIDEEVG